MEGSARVGVINEPDVQLLAASEGFFFVCFFFFVSSGTGEAGTVRPQPMLLLLAGHRRAQQGGAGQWGLSEA